MHLEQMYGVLVRLFQSFEVAPPASRIDPALVPRAVPATPPPGVQPRVLRSDTRARRSVSILTLSSAAISIARAVDAQNAATEQRRRRKRRAYLSAYLWCVDPSSGCGVFRRGWSGP